jgi:hypothetical protein
MHVAHMPQLCKISRTIMNKSQSPLLHSPGWGMPLAADAGYRGKLSNINLGGTRAFPTSPSTRAQKYKRKSSVLLWRCHRQDRARPSPGQPIDRKWHDVLMRK